MTNEDEAYLDSDLWLVGQDLNDRFYIVLSDLLKLKTSWGLVLSSA